MSRRPAQGAGLRATLRRIQTRWALKDKGYPPPCLACTLPPGYPKAHTGLGAYCPRIPPKGW